MAEQAPETQLINTGDVDHPTPISQAILDGYAPGQELYMFKDYPQFTAQELANYQGQSYTHIFDRVTQKLLGSAMPADFLSAAAEAAYSPDKFDFDPEDQNLRFTELESGITVVGLSDGPTAAFKDMAMQPFALWTEHLLKETGGEQTILFSTSGDTGPAALEAFGGIDNVEMIGMFPGKGHGNVSEFQRSQMIERGQPDNIHVLEVPGDFTYANDLQMDAEQVFDLGAVNSANIARIIAQIPYHVASYVKAIERNELLIGDPVDLSIPSGNFGNAMSAILAKRMGVPIRNIIVATNENNTLDTFLKTGVYEKWEEMFTTDSPAQDIKRSSNIWRAFNMMFANDPEKQAQFYQTWKKEGKADINEIGVDDHTVLDGIASATITSAQRTRAIRDIRLDSRGKTMIDPHTANGVAAVFETGLWTPNQGVPMLAMETAKPFKFDETMMRILGATAERPERFRYVEARAANLAIASVANKRQLFSYLRNHTGAQPKST